MSIQGTGQGLVSAWSSGKDLLKYLAGIAIGFLLCVAFNCAPIHRGAVFLKGSDSLVHDTIPMPVYVKSRIQGTPVDTNHDCFGSLYALIGTDTLTIDSANSCKNDYRGISIKHAPVIADVKIPVMAAIKKQPEERFSIPGELFSFPPLGYELSAKAMTNAAGLFAGIELKGWYRRIGLIAEVFFMLAKQSYTFLGAGVEYRFLP